MGKVREEEPSTSGGREPEMSHFYLSMTPGSRGMLGESQGESIIHKACPYIYP